MKHPNYEPPAAIPIAVATERGFELSTEPIGTGEEQGWE